MIQHPHFPMPQQRKALTPLFRHDEQKTGKGYASLTKSLRGADKAPKDRRTWGKPFPPASSPVLRLLRESLCLVDNLTGASPLQGNPLFLAADAGGKRLSCNEAPRRTNRMQLKAALCTCPPLAYRVHRLPPRGSDKLPPPPHKRAVSAPPGSGNRSRRPPRPCTLSPRSIRPLRPFSTAFCRAGKRRNMPTCFGSTARVISRPVSSGMRKVRTTRKTGGLTSPVRACYLLAP